MPQSEAPLLKQWDLLQEQVVPRLVNQGGPTRRPMVWAAGDISDAVAVSLAYGHGPYPTAGLQAFATYGPPEPPDISFSVSDIRGIPEGARRDGLCRSGGGWVPAPSIAEQVLLGHPPEPVDLVVLRSRRAGCRRCVRYGRMLRPGGHLLVLGDPPVEVSADPGLEEIPGSPFLRRRDDPESDTAEGGHEGEERAELRTLAHKLLEQELVSRHLNLARGLARRFSGHGEPVDDLRQVAFVALVLAARRFDPAQNASFSTYATATILGELKRYFRDKSWMMRVPRQVQERYLAVKTAREELYQELACSPTIDQIARRLRISDEAVLEAIEAGDNFMPQSLDVGLDDDSPGREVPVIDPGFDVMLERNLLMAAIPRLSKREQVVLKRVYLDGWTQRRVAQEIGVSQMQVSRLLHASGQKVRAWSVA